MKMPKRCWSKQIVPHTAATIRVYMTPLPRPPPDPQIRDEKHKIKIK